MEIKPIYLVLAGGAALFLLKGNSGTSIISPGTTTPVNPGNTTGLTDQQIITSVPYDGGGGVNYLTKIYPAMLRLRPDVGNPNYRLTDAEAQQYMNNYLTLRQALPTWNNFPDILDRARSHWKQYGVSQKLTFLPISPTDGTAYVPPPTPVKSSGGGFFGKLLKVVTSVIPAILGTETAADLSAEEQAMLIEGSGVAIEVLNIFIENGDSQQQFEAMAASDKVQDVLTQII
ncbi:MAG: hypothetical protein ABW007_02125 [Chitinophagaceae bacterium]